MHFWKKLRTLTTVVYWKWLIRSFWTKIGYNRNFEDTSNMSSDLFYYQRFLIKWRYIFLIFLAIKNGQFRLFPYFLMLNTIRHFLIRKLFREGAPVEQAAPSSSTLFSNRIHFPFNSSQLFLKKANSSLRGYATLI